MTRQTTGVTLGSPARHVAKFMHHYNVGTIPVVNDDQHLLGCVTAHDLWSLLCAERGENEGAGIGGITCALPPTVSADDTVEVGARILFQNPRLDALPSLRTEQSSES